MSKIKKYMSFDTYNGDMSFHETREEALKVAEEWLDYYRDRAGDDGWPEDMSGLVGVAEITDTTTILYEKTEKDYDDDEWDNVSQGGNFESVVEYCLERVLKKTPTPDPTSKAWASDWDTPPIGAPYHE